MLIKTDDMPLSMPEVTSPLDLAWAVVKNEDPDKVEKIAPLVPLAALAAPAFFGGLGAATGSGYRFTDQVDDPTTYTGKRTVFDPGFKEDAAVYDPVTGYFKVKDLGDSRTDRAIGAGTGALQAVNPLNYLRFGGKVLGAGGNAVRTSDRFADTVRVADGVTDTTAGPMQVIGQGAGRGVENFGRGVQRFANRGFPRGIARTGQLVGNTGRQFGEDAGLLAANVFGGALSTLMNNDETDQGFGMQGQTQGFGSGGLGINDISNVQSNAVADQQIWNPDAYRGQQQVENFEGYGTQGGGEFGGFGTQKGENMFVKDKGSEILKQVEEMMNKALCAGCTKPECIGKMSCPYGAGEDMAIKAKCPECGKEDCVGKAGCGMAKAEDKKKPAHGMVIVIGSKAGPGPSKEGKREKLDSEKKKE